mgnify:FL=1
MAIVDDIRKDRRTKNVLAQTNTKTVSAPPSSTGLTGDQLPAEVFSVADFDLVRNQVHLEEKNFQLLEALNTMGQISNMQSQSGPIPGTSTIKNVTVTDGTVTTLFRPDAGQVWLWMNWSASTSGQGGSTINHYTYLSDGSYNDYLSVITAASTTPKNETPYAAIYVTNEVYAKVSSGITTGSVVWLGSFVRVR